MRSEVDLSFLDPCSSASTGPPPPEFKGVIPGLRQLDSVAAHPHRASQLTILGWLISGLFHLATLALLMLLISPFGHGRRTSITLEMGLSEPSELAVSEMVVLPPMLETPAATVNEPAETSTVDEGELPTEAEEQSGDEDSEPGEDESKSDGQRPASPGQTGTFFGTEALGDRFVYIVDMSSSMRATVRGTGKTRLRIAAEEVVRSINNLTTKQKFYVMLFATETRPMFDHRVPRLTPATAGNKRHLARWLLSVPNSSGTDPRAALRTALRLRPSAVFLLSDGEFNGQSSERNRAVLNGNPSVEEVVRQNRVDDIPIHTIALENNYESRMQSLAQSTGGTYRFVDSSANSNRPFRISEFAAESPARRARRLSNTAMSLPNTLKSRPNSTLSQQGVVTNFTPEQQAEAILLHAATLWKRGQKELAKQRLRELTKSYPNTKAAAVARRQLPN